MSHTSDVVWVEGPPADTAHSAWNALTYKVGDASGDFTKPVFTIEYGSGRQTQTELAEASQRHASALREEAASAANAATRAACSRAGQRHAP